MVAGEITHRAEQNAVRAARDLQRGFGQRMALIAIGHAAHIAELKLDARQRQRLEHAQRLAVTSGPMPSPAKTAIFIAGPSFSRINLAQPLTQSFARPITSWR
jgi:hypothetical protein